jgi:hypothetical protein
MDKEKDANKTPMVYICGGKYVLHNMTSLKIECFTVVLFFSKETTFT